MVPKKITSLQHPIVKELVKLRTNKAFREKCQQVVVAGRKEVEEAPHLEKVLLLKGDHPTKEVIHVTEDILKKVTGLANPEPIAGVVTMPKPNSLRDKQWILALNRVADPGNVGSLIRTALALGWEGVFFTEGSADPFNDKTLRAGRGAIFRLPYRTGTVEELIALQKKNGMIPFLGDLGGSPLGTIKAPESGLLILGNEATGPEDALKRAFPAVSIPIKEIESLNVAAAGAIFLYNLKL